MASDCGRSTAAERCCTNPVLHGIRWWRLVFESQDTTGPMTRDELKDLACLGFSADLVMQVSGEIFAAPSLVYAASAHSCAELKRGSARTRQ
jgi:aconitase B